MPYKDKEKRNEAVRRYREKRKVVKPPKPPGLVERIERLEEDMKKIKEDVCLIWKRGSTESDC